MSFLEIQLGVKGITDKIIGSEIESLESIDSTNDYLQRKLTQGAVREGWVVTAAEQTRGRGQRGAEWHSIHAQNILMSTVLYPSFLPVDKQFYLSMAVALGVASFIRELLPGSRVNVKWPNDILVEEKKVGGILIENSLQGNIIKNSIVGIGININAQPHGNTAWPAACLGDFGDPGRPEELIPVLCNSLDIYYQKLRAGGASETMYGEYMASLYALHEERVFTDLVANQNFTGSITGIDAFGRLLVESAYGEKAYALKEIQFKK
jgi:BirA family biotin operon repressor/biotin-[acetyl-CoA-carboxylase] ligase